MYLDLDGDGELDAGEPVQVTAADDSMTAVDETGRFRFTEIGPGQPFAETQYSVRQVLPPHWQSTAPVSGEYLVEMSASTIVADLRFGTNPPDAPTDVVLSSLSMDENTSSIVALATPAIPAKTA